jgi:hypothetical protein
MKRRRIIVTEPPTNPEPSSGLNGVRDSARRRNGLGTMYWTVKVATHGRRSWLEGIASHGNRWRH